MHARGMNIEISFTYRLAVVCYFHYRSVVSHCTLEHIAPITFRLRFILVFHELFQVLHPINDMMNDIHLKLYDEDICIDISD